LEKTVRHQQKLLDHLDAQILFLLEKLENHTQETPQPLVCRAHNGPEMVALKKKGDRQN
jgi:hypothetical protein